jgi:hypothetical protein
MPYAIVTTAVKNTFKIYFKIFLVVYSKTLYTIADVKECSLCIVLQIL